LWRRDRVGFTTLSLADQDPGSWARICRVQAALKAHADTRALLLELAAEFDAPLSSGNEVLRDKDNNDSHRAPISL